VYALVAGGTRTYPWDMGCSCQSTRGSVMRAAYARTTDGASSGYCKLVRCTCRDKIATVLPAACCNCCVRPTQDLLQLHNTYVCALTATPRQLATPGTTGWNAGRAQGRPQATGTAAVRTSCTHQMVTVCVFAEHWLALRDLSTAPALKK
jgi:hypothetical protein